MPYISLLDAIYMFSLERYCLLTKFKKKLVYCETFIRQFCGKNKTFSMSAPESLFNLPSGLFDNFVYET